MARAAFFEADKDSGALMNLDNSCHDFTFYATDTNQVDKAFIGGATNYHLNHFQMDPTHADYKTCLTSPEFYPFVASVKQSAASSNLMEHIAADFKKHYDWIWLYNKEYYSGI